MKTMGVYRRGTRWYYRATLQPNGRRPSFSLGYGIRTKAEAERVALQIAREHLDAKLGILDASRATLETFRAEYIKHRKPLGLSPATIRRDDQALRSLAEVVGDNCHLHAITQRKIGEWQGVLLGRGVKPQTVNSYLRHIKAALNTAVDWGLLSKFRKLKSVREPQAPPRHLTPEEVKRLLAAEDNPDRRRLWIFFLETGARRQEVVGLRWENVHLGDKPYCILFGKGQKARMVPLMPDAVAALGEPRDIGPVFTFSHGRREKASAVLGWAYSKWFKSLARKAGLPHARLHDLRHTAATWMISRNVPVRVVQEILGHVSITTTERYSKALVSDLYDAMREGLD